jgi:DHA2 family multidrug resistance protein
VSRISPEDPLLQQRLQALQSLLHQNSGPFAPLADALSRAYGLLQGDLNQQARLLSYVDDFRYMSLVCFLCVPIVFALKKTKTRSGQMSGGH